MPKRTDTLDRDPIQTGAGLPQPELAADAVSSVLRPLARLMIDHGLQLPAMLELLKKALVEEAVESFGIGSKATTDSRVALLSGVHRKDVKRLRESSAAQAPTPPAMTVASSVVARWISDPLFLDIHQQPRRLAKSPGRSLPGSPDFAALVASVSKDVGARAVLDELCRLGVVCVASDGYVELLTTSFVPQDGRREAFNFLAHNVSEHLSAAVHNLKPGRRSPPMLEQSAFCERLSAEQARQLETLARKLWTQMLQQFLQAAAVSEQRSLGASDARDRVWLGVYWNHTPGASPDSSTESVPTSLKGGSRSRVARRQPDQREKNEGTQS